MRLPSNALPNPSGPLLVSPAAIKHANEIVKNKGALHYPGASVDAQHGEIEAAH